MNIEDLNLDGKITDLNKMAGHFKELLQTANKDHKEAVDAAIKLQIVPQEEKPMKFKGIDCSVQLFDGAVKIVFPNNALTKTFYNEIEKQYPKTFIQKLKWLLT